MERWKEYFEDLINETSEQNEQDNAQTHKECLVNRRQNSITKTEVQELPK